MHDTRRLRERDPELFRLVNTLKAARVVYRKTQPRLYDELVERRGDIDHELGSDDCYMNIVPDKSFLLLSFYPDDMDCQNRLRRKLSINEMKFYITLLQVYNERYVADGDYVSVGTDEIMDAWEQLGFSTKTTKMSAKLFDLLMKTMKQFGIVAEVGNEQFLIQPGISFGLDLRAFMDYYSAVLTPWFAKQETGAEDIKEGE